MARKLQGKSKGKSLFSALQGQKYAESKKQKKSRNKNLNEKPLSEEKLQPKATQLPLKSFIPFSQSHKLLLVGEGDFSFAVSILRSGYIRPENLIVTSYDSSVTELELKYPSTFCKNYEEITSTYKVKVFFKVDGTQLIRSLKVNNKQKFLKTLGWNFVDYVMFNFPHTGKGIKDQDRNIRDHQKLVLGYLKSCQDLFKVAEQPLNRSIADVNIVSNQVDEPKIILSVFEGEPYDSWNIKILSKSLGLKVERSGALQWGLFPGYQHRRTNNEQGTTKEASARKARIYVFEKFKKAKAKIERNSDSDSDD